MTHRFAAIGCIVGTMILASLTTGGCSATPESLEARDQLVSDARAASERFRSEDARTDVFFRSAYAYAVFPKITKGAAGIAGAYGRGVVFRNGQMLGYTDVTQGSIGAQLGGMSWSEIVFFQDEWTFNRFRANQFAGTADASFAGPKQGGTNTLNYADGVMIFTMDTRGFAISAAVGAQQFNFEPGS